MQYVWYVVIFYLGVGVGVFTMTLVNYRNTYGGTIHIIRNPDKTLYSLEIDDDPEILIGKDRVVFRIEVTDNASE